MKLTIFTFVLTIFAAHQTFTQDLPSFVPPVAEQPKTNQPPPVVQSALTTNKTSEINGAPSVDLKVKSSDTPLFITPGALLMKGQEKTNMVRRLLTLYNKVKEEQRAAANAATTNLAKARGSSTNQPTNAVVKTARPKPDKNPPPPIFIAKDSATNYVAPPKDTNIFLYSQQLWIPRTPEEMEARKHAIARLMGLEQGVWGYTGPAQGAPNKSPEYVVNQSPLAPLPSTAVNPPPWDFWWSPSYRREYYITRPNYYSGFEFNAWLTSPHYYNNGWSVRRQHNHRVRRPIVVNRPSTRVNLYGDRRPAGGQQLGGSQIRVASGGAVPNGGQTLGRSQIPAGGNQISGSRIPSGGQQPGVSQGPAGGQRPSGGQLPRVNQGMGGGGQRPSGGGQGPR